MNTAKEKAIEENEKLIEHVTKISSEIGARQAIVAYEKQKQTQQQKEKKKRLYNAKILLKNYRVLKSYIGRIDGRAKAAYSKTLMVNETENLINLIEFSEDIVSSIKDQSQKTIVMIKHLDNALDALELIYKQENNERHFNVLKKRYIEGMAINKIGELYNMNSRSIYKIIDSTSERLAILLFGVYGIKLE